MDATDLCFTPATALAAAIRARTLSPVEIGDAVLARIEALSQDAAGAWPAGDRAQSEEGLLRRERVGRGVGLGSAPAPGQQALDAAVEVEAGTSSHCGTS